LNAVLCPDDPTAIEIDLPAAAAKYGRQCGLDRGKCPYMVVKGQNQGGSGP
jgi:hypothetical protein